MQRSLVSRQRERRVALRTAGSESTGRLILADVNRGRNVPGVEPGEIAKLLVLEQLPAPFHKASGG